MSIDGKWDCISKTPMGDQPSVMDLKSNGNVVTGTSINMLGTIDVTNGKLDGNTFTWQMEMTSPFPMKLQRRRRDRWRLDGRHRSPQDSLASPASIGKRQTGST